MPMNAETSGGSSRPFENPRVESRGFSGNNDIFSAAVALTRVPMMVSDPSLPDNPIVFANRAFCALTGYAPDELIGRNPRLMQGAGTDRTCVAQIREAVARQAEITIEILNYRRDGSPYWNALFISPVFAADGTLLYYFSSHLDVTRRRDAERAMEQASRLQGLGNLAGGVAHEFNNLLTIIRGNLEPLISSNENERSAHRLQRMRDAAERAAGLTGSMLAFARRQRLDERIFDLCTLLAGLQPVLARTVGEHIVLELEVPASPVCIRADPEQLRISLMNVCLNAREAMPCGGRVRVAVAQRRAHSGRPLEVELSVADCGCGMSPEVAARALDPFFTTKPSGRNAGLGLSMTYGFMRQTGGRLELSSQEGVGTVVRMMFPAMDARPV
jgi:PAS domain S-box-containing protein